MMKFLAKEDDVKRKNRSKDAKEVTIGIAEDCIKASR